MEDIHQQPSSTQDVPEIDRERDLKAFDDTKAGVKGLVDAGISKIPHFFVRPTDRFSSKVSLSDSTHLKIPVIDLKHIQQDAGRRRDVVEEVRLASETWGFFQVVNHGIPKQVLDEMIEGIRRFHQQPHDVKKEYYTRDTSTKVRYFSNLDLYFSEAANWRDTLVCQMAPNSPKPEELPSACGEIMIRYSEHVKSLGHTLLELLSEALGLKPKYLEDMECGKGHVLISHYYPACPEPDRTIGTSEHSDPDFFTILLQDHIGGLQVLYQSQWVDIQPLEGALVINLGDLMQLISNDKFKSAKHRVLANLVGPRISVACFFSTHLQPLNVVYAPIRELLSDENPPLYKGTLVRDYVVYYNSIELGHPALDHIRL